MRERLGILGGGAIASGIAAVAAEHGEVVVWVRSDLSAQRVRRHVERIGGEHEARVEVVVDNPAALDGATFVIEAIVEDAEEKARHLAQLGVRLGPEALLATTTSSLSVAELADASGRPDRFVGLHVFNPVARMELVELAFPPAASPGTRARARELCRALGKTAVEVPDLPGFVVNRLLFPYLFSAVRLLEESGMAAEDVDTCMKLGAGHPLGPLALLDLVGLDVSAAIGEEIGESVPARVQRLVQDGALGRKAGRGFYTYPRK
ncbi:MAG: 3-hydroxyacyl-CoA dehydrogenase family protein [Solirubrobacteraceae bacterium]